MRPRLRILLGLGLGALLLALAAAIGCVSYTPPPSRAVNRERQIPAPPDDVWRAVIRYFSEHNIPIENMDHSSFFIKTKDVDLGGTFALFEGKAPPIQNKFCDCGSASISGAWTTESRILLSFNIVLESARPDATMMRVNTFFEGVKLGKVNLHSSGYDTTVQLTCVSTGALETELQDYVDAIVRHKSA